MSVVAVYLGTLAAVGSPGLSTAAGAVIGYIAMFSPGMILQTGALGPWATLRSHDWINSFIRGVNAAAIGLIYTAVYRIWTLQRVDDNHSNESQFGQDPWWVVVVVVAFAGGMWFRLPAPGAIFMGGLMGLIWYGVAKS